VGERSRRADQRGRSSR